MKFSIQLFVISLLFVAFSLQAQNINRHANNNYLYNQIEQNPDLANGLLKAEKEIAEAAKKSNTQKRTAFTIPVIVHVVYNSSRPGDNISDEQIMSQIEVLNEDYQMRNEDIEQVPDIFKDLIANVDIEFCLANRDENGNFTTGITRTETTVDEFTIDDNLIKRPELGGVAAWDREKYLNIWVGRLENQILGYATPPGFPSSIDGVVIGTRNFGRGDQYNLHLGYNLGRTATHEIGRWLGLRNPSGNFEGCEYDDGIDDTPLSEKPYFNCPILEESQSCGSQDLTMNFMEFVNDACMYMFTLGQKEYIVNVLNSARATVASGEGCGIIRNDGKDVEISVAETAIFFCNDMVFPLNVTLTNLGTEDVNAVSIAYTVNDSLFNFTNDVDLQVDSVINLNISNLNIFDSGIIEIELTEIDGEEDAVKENNFTTIEIVIPEFDTLPFAEDFEDEFLWQDVWTIDNPDNDEFQWLRSDENGAPPSGEGCLVFNNFSGDEENNPRSTFDHLITPNFDFTNNTKVEFSFDRAYALYDDELSDGLLLSYSLDCENESVWQSFWMKEWAELATNPTYIEDPFIPEAGDWMNETIDLTNELAGQKSVRFRISNVSGWGQLIWIDNVQLNGIVSDIKTFSLSKEFTIAPNPSNSGQFTLTSFEPNNKNYELTVLDLTGKQIFSDQLNSNESQYYLNLTEVPNGIYLLRINNEESIYADRIMITK